MRSDEVFIQTVLKFYNEEGRHTLLWRKRISSYKILVSEIMLQQTQVERVTPKFKDWMRTYPTLESLGKASLQDILIMWQGLGYQRRAKALYQIAQTYTKLPKSFEDLLLLPGVGSYTASAICAFAYNRFSYPMLETNIRTALIHYYHQSKEKIEDKILSEDLLRISSHPLVQKVGARTWYYALMDYGAYLKSKNISHNKKSAHYTKQTKYKGSFRELRAKILFAITHKEKLPRDERNIKALEALLKEGYITKQKNTYIIKK